MKGGVCEIVRVPSDAFAAGERRCRRRGRRGHCGVEFWNVFLTVFATANKAFPTVSAWPTMSAAMRETPPTRVAVAQMTSTRDVEANLRCAAELCARAKEKRCHAIFLPEAFACVGASKKDADDVAESIADGPVVRRMKSLAREHGLWISCCVAERCEEEAQAGKRYNSHVMVSSSGDVHGDTYRKIHLFDADVPGGAVLRESEYTAPGTSLTTHEVPGLGVVGASICYDLRFPDVYQALRFERGADVIVVPSAFTKKTGAAHWETLLRARAIETQCYVVAAAQCGDHGGGRSSYGHAMIIDPWGEVIARMDDPDSGIGIAVADISLGRVDEVRRGMPLEAHRRSVREA